jgi:hypothetical protein
MWGSSVWGGIARMGGGWTGRTRRQGGRADRRARSREEINGLSLDFSVPSPFPIGKGDRVR